MFCRSIFLYILIMLPLLAMGQDYVVESFDIVPTDLTARTNGRIDNNGRKCGLIKVYVKDAITATDGPVIGEVIDRGMEKWVFVSHDAKQIELLFKEHMPLMITFNELNFPTLTGQMTYKLKLKERETSHIGMTPIISDQNQSILTPPSTENSNHSLPASPLISYVTQNSGQSTNELDPVIQKLLKNMVYVEGGSFMMGARDNIAYEDEYIVHQETVGSFYIGKYEVTQEEWQAVMGQNPSYFKGDKLPVENVSWNQCQQFIRKLNALTGKNFRLPTEIEWEFAARGGNYSKDFRYSGSNKIQSVAWYRANSGEKTHPVGRKSANELGLFDMSGNVSEWTSSFWREVYNSNADKNYLVYRGGNWNGTSNRWLNEESCRVTYRDRSGASGRNGNLGLRLAY